MKNPEFKALGARERRRAALTYANQLAKLAENAPDDFMKRELYRTVHRLRRRYLLSKEKRMKIVMRIVVSGASTIRQISEETGFSEPGVRKILSLLLTENAVRSCTMGGVRNRGRGGATKYYFPI